MDASSQEPYSSYIAIGVCFVIVCAIVGCIIYYITKDNTKTEKFSPKIINQITTPSLNSCGTMINILIRDMYTRIMGTPSPVKNYECTPESDRDSFLDTLYYILQVPTLQILNNATSIDNLDKTNLIILWSTAMTGLSNGSMRIAVTANSDRIISSVTITREMPTGNVSMSELMDRFNSSSYNSYPQIPSYTIPDNYKQSLTDISKKASQFVTLQDITDLKADTSSTITADNMTKYLLLSLVHTGTFFTK